MGGPLSTFRDISFEQWNIYHPKIRLTIELNPRKFLDTRLVCVTMVNRKSTKLPIAWSSKVPDR